MENVIVKFFEGLKKQATKKETTSAEEKIGRKLKAKEKDDIKERLTLKYSPVSWMEKNILSKKLVEISSFIPSSEEEELFDFLALDVGYKRTVKQAFDDGFPLLRELLVDINDQQFAAYESSIKEIPVHLIELYSFFVDEIKSAREKSAIPMEAVTSRISTFAQKAKEGTRVSHASKFTNPDVKFPRIYAQADFVADGYVRTGNAQVDFDMHINAASLQVYKFLSLKIDERSILDIFENGYSQSLRDIFAVDQQKYDFWSESFRVCLNQSQNKTDRLLKQVYFPVGETYHQLSILFPSSLSFKMKEKVDTMNMLSSASYVGKKKKKHEEFFGEPFSTIFDLTLQRYGGDHPKNISALNNKHQNVYLLPSPPPTLARRKVQPPRQDFFKDSLWVPGFKEDFVKLHKLLNQDPNNMHIRKQRDWLIRAIVYQVADRLWFIRSLDSGWSDSDNYQKLPEYQKIWLDQQYKAMRQESSQWLATMEKDLARWFFLTYRKLLDHEALPFGDDELPHVTRIISECEEALR